MKMFGKAKTPAKSDPKEVGPQLPEIAALMTKIIERLDILERKINRVISQMSAGPFAGRGSSKPVPQSSVSSQSFRQPNPSGHSGEVKPNRGRREKILYKVVCADCHRDCEIPFKPAGERPVYCKGCFSKRKAGNSVTTNEGNRQEPLPKTPGPLNPPRRQVVVTKKGVGKVTVSEIVQPFARAASSKTKGDTSEKKSRRA